MEEICHCCGFEAPTKSYTFNKKTGLLCEICAGSPAGTAFFHPKEYKEQKEILAQIAYIGNKILDELKKTTNL